METSQINQKRQVAHKLQIRHLLEGTYHQKEGWEPNHLLINDQKISRINLLAVIVAQNQDQTFNFLLEDGTGQISLRFFDLPKKIPQIGDTVLIIAKIREYNQERYLVPEIIKKIPQKWLEVRKNELKNFSSATPPPPLKKEPLEANQAPYEYLLSLIKKLDQGQGADVEEILQKSSLPGGEELVETLLKEGDIFEISPGKVKILK